MYRYLIKTNKQGLCQSRVAFKDRLFPPPLLLLSDGGAAECICFSDQKKTQNYFHTGNRDVERVCCGTDVDRPCCCDDTGHASWVVSTAGVL